MYTYLLCKTISSQFNGIFPEIQVKSKNVTLSLVQNITFFPNKHSFIRLCLWDKVMPLAHNFLNYFWWNPSRCNALRPATLPQGEPAHAAPPAPGLQHMPGLFKQPPCSLVRALPRHPTQLRTLTQFPIDAHSLESNPTSNVQLKALSC